MPKKKKPIPKHVDKSETQVKDFFDMLSPGAVKFNVDHILCGDTYRCVWAVREYPPQTSDQAILCRFGDKENVTVHIYSRYVDNMEQRKILQNATRKNKMQSASDDVQESITAEGNMEDVVTLLAEMRKNKEPLLHCAVFLELCAPTLEKLKELQSEVAMELTREKLTVDRLTLRPPDQDPAEGRIPHRHTLRLQPARLSVRAGAPGFRCCQPVSVKGSAESIAFWRKKALIYGLFSPKQP